MRTRLRHGVLSATLVAFVCAAPGCGELGGDTPPERKTPVVTAKQLQRYEEGTPERAFLEWFRALQLGESSELADLYVPSLGLTPGTLARQRAEGAYAIDPLAPPVIRQVRVNGRRARVLARFRTGQIWPNGRVNYTSKQIVPFELRRVGGRWLLASNGFVELVARDGPDTEEFSAKMPSVGRRQLSRYEPGSPERAFLEWFGALQRTEARKAARYYAPALGIQPRELARLRERADGFDVLGPPRVVGVTTNGDTATVTVRNRTAKDSKSFELEFVESAPTPFELRRIDGRWVLPNNAFLEVLARVPSG